MELYTGYFVVRHILPDKIYDSKITSLGVFESEEVVIRALYHHYCINNKEINFQSFSDDVKRDVDDVKRDVETKIFPHPKIPKYYYIKHKLNILSENNIHFYIHN
jgi:hypothetical protein